MQDSFEEYKQEVEKEFRRLFVDYSNIKEVEVDAKDITDFLANKLKEAENLGFLRGKN